MRFKKAVIVAALATATMTVAAPLASAQDVPAQSGQATQEAPASPRADVGTKAGLDFAGTNVRIWHDPTAGSAVNGHGNSGDRLTEISPNLPQGEPYTCDYGNHTATTKTWFHVRNDRTGVSGWVPSCWITNV